MPGAYDRQISSACSLIPIGASSDFHQIPITHCLSLTPLSMPIAHARENACSAASGTAFVLRYRLDGSVNSRIFQTALFEQKITLPATTNQHTKKTTNSNFINTLSQHSIAGCALLTSRIK